MNKKDYIYEPEDEFVDEFEEEQEDLDSDSEETIEDEVEDDIEESEDTYPDPFEDEDLEEDYEDEDYIQKWQEEIEDISGEAIITDVEPNGTTIISNNIVIQIDEDEDIGMVIDPELLTSIEEDKELNKTYKVIQNTVKIDKDGNMETEQELLDIHKVEDDRIYTLSKSDSVDDLPLHNMIKTDLKADLEFYKSEIKTKALELVRKGTEEDEELEIEDKESKEEKTDE